MKQYPSFAIVVSFFGLWITSFFSSENQVFTGFVFILTFGILHGANDLLILKNLLTEKSTISFSKMLFYYLLMVFLGGFLFYIIPSAILIFFVLISGFHFGEQQINYLPKNTNKLLLKGFQILYGLLILFLLFEFHNQEVQTIIGEITSCQITTNAITYSLYAIIVLFGISFTYIYTKQGMHKTKLLMELFYLVVFAIIFKVSSLIWGFAIYFIVWHSIPSIIDQVKFLYGSFSKNNFINYFKSAVLYWIVSLIGLAIFYFGFKDLQLFNSMFFSFLAAITFPHVLVILKMFEKN
jgi:beta-carotene 15,15'-dioxygenase